VIHGYDSPMAGMDDVGRTRSCPPIAYLLKRFPRLSETFILHEMLALEARGVPLRVYALLDPQEKVVHPDVKRLAAPVVYLPNLTRAGVRPYLAAQATLLRRSPARYFYVMWRALHRGDRRAGLRHFLRATWLGLDLERHRLRHLHAHFANAPALTAQLTSLLFDVPFSFTAHAKDIYTTAPPRLAERMRNARFVVTCTGHNETYLSGLVDAPTASHLHRIYHGIDRNRFFPMAEVPSSPPVILAVGRFVEKKGFPYLIDACARLKAQGIPFRCQIVGGGPLKEELQARIASAGLTDTVDLLAARAQDELVDLYRSATVVALPCVVLENGDRDGIPNVLVEAMSMGRPVVSTAISGIPELIEDGKSGILVPPRDAGALADALIRLLGDVELRRGLAEAAQHTVSRDFDMARNVERLESLFMATAGDARRPAAPVAAPGSSRRLTAG
jgi:glycosyltransferase involved in cell wall biosynthesis